MFPPPIKAVAQVKEKPAATVEVPMEDVKKSSKNPDSNWTKEEPTVESIKQEVNGVPMGPQSTQSAIDLKSEN